MIGNGFEFYFHWRKTFDAMTTKKKVQRSHFPTILPHFWTSFYGSKSLTFPCESLTYNILLISPKIFTELKLL